MYRRSGLVANLYASVAREVRVCLARHPSLICCWHSASGSGEPNQGESKHGGLPTRIGDESAIVLGIAPRGASNWGGVSPMCRRFDLIADFGRAALLWLTGDQQATRGRLGAFQLQYMPKLVDAAIFPQR